MPASKARPELVSRLIACICTHYIPDRNPLPAFAEGGAAQPGSGTADYAVLRNEQAERFLRLIHENEALFGVRREDYALSASRLLPGETKYPHSCYPRNLRRWMSGTVSRKKRCRVELCALLFCWSDCWGNDPDGACRPELRQLCAEYAAADGDFSLSLLWQALEAAARR